MRQEARSTFTCKVAGFIPDRQESLEVSDEGHRSP